MDKADADKGLRIRQSRIYVRREQEIPGNGIACIDGEKGSWRDCRTVYGCRATRTRETITNEISEVVKWQAVWDVAWDREGS